MIWSETFLQTYTQPDLADKYRTSLTENIFICMEMSSQSYEEVINMPVSRFYEYLKWKSKLLEDKRKAMEEETAG